MKEITIILAAFILFNCSGADVGWEAGEFLKGQHYIKTIDSDTFNTVLDRVNFLEKEIKAFSPIKDAEYELFNVNGFHFEKNTTTPGGSSYDYRFVVKIDPADISKWTDGFSRNDSIAFDSTWTEKIILKRKENWERHSAPIVLSRPGGFVELYLFKDEGIIFKRINAL